MLMFAVVTAYVTEPAVPAVSVPVWVPTDTVLTGVVGPVCVTAKSFTAFAGMMKVNAKVSLVVMF